MGTRKLSVYSPCADDLAYKFNSNPRVLSPGVTKLAEGEARHVVAQFGKYGVCGYSAARGDAIKKAAKLVWERGNRQWAEEIILDWRRANKEKLDAGIPVEEPKVVKVAKKALKMVAVLLALLLPGAVFAAEAEVRSANFTYKYDVASTTMTYCAFEGRNGDPFGPAFGAQGQIETSGSSTTVTEVTTGDNPFADVSEGDVLYVDRGNAGIDVRVVDTKTDDTEVVVNTAVDWSNGYTFTFYKVNCGTTAAAGWIPVSAWDRFQMTVQYEAGDLGALAVVWECKDQALGATAIRVYPGVASDCGDGTLSGTTCEYTTTGQGMTVKVPHQIFGSCRLGLAYVTSDGATREDVTAYISVGR